MATKRGREHLRCPTEGLRLLGTDPREVKDVVITHLHYDHVGNFELFPAATLHLQELEMRYATGATCATNASARLRGGGRSWHVRRVYAGRVRFHDGDAELFPNPRCISSAGTRWGCRWCASPRAAGGVLAFRASHFYANMEQTRPFPIVWSVADMVAGYDRLRRLAASPGHIIPATIRWCSSAIPRRRRSSKG